MTGMCDVMKSAKKMVDIPVSLRQRCKAVEAPKWQSVGPEGDRRLCQRLPHIAWYVEGLW